MKHNAVRRLLGFGLLAAQLVASGAASLAHARERYDAPHHIESANAEQCLTIHDATRCVVCAWSHARSDVPPQRAVTPTPTHVASVSSPVVAEPPMAPAPRDGRARAPPISQG